MIIIYSMVQSHSCDYNLFYGQSHSCDDYSMEQSHSCDYNLFYGAVS